MLDPHVSPAGLRAWRRRAGLTQQDLAAVLRVHRTLVGKMELGKAFLRGWQARLLRERFGVTAEELTAPAPTALTKEQGGEGEGTGRAT